MNGVNDFHRLCGDEVGTDFLDFVTGTLHIDIAVERLDILIGTQLQNITIVLIGLHAGTAIVTVQLLEQHLLQGNAVVLQLDCLGNRVLFAADSHLDGGVGQRDRTLNSITAGNEVVCGLVRSLNFLTIIADTHTGNLAVGVLVGKNERALLHTLLDTGIQRLELTQRLMDSHLFSSHKLVLLIFDF